MVDGKYVVSLLGCANLIELILLIGSFSALSIASPSIVQLTNFPSNVNGTNDKDSISLYDIDVYIIKQVAQTILIIILLLTLISFLAHVLFAFRYRYSWHRLSTGIAFICLIYAFALFAISVAVSCWEDKLRKRLTTIVSKDIGKTRIGSAAAAATFGFAACLIFLAESLIRFRRLADKIRI